MFFWIFIGCLPHCLATLTWACFIIFLALITGFSCVFSVPLHHHWQTKALLPHRMVVHTLVAVPRTVSTGIQAIYFLKDSEGFRRWFSAFCSPVHCWVPKFPEIRWALAAQLGATIHLGVGHQTSLLKVAKKHVKHRALFLAIRLLRTPLANQVNPCYWLNLSVGFTVRTL